MPESTWSIPTPDGKMVYGVLNTRAGGNRKAVLHVHGLTGHPYEVAQTAMAQSFPDSGYDVIRPYLYASRPNARNLIDCTIRIHAKDINTIVRHFRTAYAELYAAGHSYGGPSLMSSRHDVFAAISLWDPTYDAATLFGEKDLPPLNDYYLIPGGCYKLMGRAMYDERLHFTQDYSRSLSAQCATPLQIITAANGFWGRYDESFDTYAAGASERVFVDGSVHCFFEEGTTKPLLDHTRRWFDRFSKP